jgi:hypothetical protein
MTPLPDLDLRPEVDTLDPGAWYDCVAGFDDANLYQVWQQGGGRDRRAGVSRFVLRDGSVAIAAAELRIYRVPLLWGGIAYALWGPLCRPRAYDRLDRTEILRQALRALREEYVVRRGMLLRLNPRVLVEQDRDPAAILAHEGYAPVSHARPSRSLIVDLGPGLDALRSGLDKKWRNCLSKAERSEITVESGSSLALFDEFVGVYTRMLSRKQFQPSADIEKHRRLQEALSEPCKMQVTIARVAGEACAGAIHSALGDTAVYLFGGTDEVGMRVSASYLVQWDILRRLKEQGTARYDLNGIDPVGNPGTYHFKSGLAGKHGTEVAFVGPFQAVAPSLGSYGLLLIEKLRHALRSRSSRPLASAAQA